MKKQAFLLLIMLNFAIAALSQQQNRLVILGKTLIDTKNFRQIATLDKQYNQALSIGRYVFLSDSNEVNIYKLEPNTLSLLRSYRLTANAKSLIYMLGFEQSDSLPVVYAMVQQDDNNSSKVYKIGLDTAYSIYDLGQFDPGLAFYESDTNGYFVIYKLTFAYYTFTVTLRYINLSVQQGVLSDSVQNITFNYNNVSFNVQKLLLSPDYQQILFLTDGTFAFFIGTIFNANAEQFNRQINLNNAYTAAFSPTGKYLFYPWTNKLIVYELDNDQFDTVYSTNVAITNVLPTAAGNLVLTYSGSEASRLGIVYNPDSLGFLAIDDTSLHFSQDLGYPTLLAGPMPYFNFLIAPVAQNVVQLQLERDLYDSNLFRKIPDTIIWLLDTIAFDTTAKPNHQTELTFYSIGLKRLSAKALWYKNDSAFSELISTHYYFNPISLNPELIADTFKVYCDTPNYLVDFSQYVANPDSVVWFINNHLITRLKNKTRLRLRSPGFYKVFVYQADTVLSDSILILYKPRFIDPEQIRILIDDQEFDPEGNLICTQSGVVNFRIILPENLPCPDQTYVVRWDFGDNQTQTSLNRFISHRYLNPGTYTVTIQLINRRTRAAYIFRFPLTVSMNPVEQAPHFINLTRMEPAQLAIGKDIILSQEPWFTNNTFYVKVDSTLWDQATFRLIIDDTAYANSGGQFSIFADLATENAQNLQISLFTRNMDSALIVKDFYTQPYDRRVMFGLPKVKNDTNLKYWTCPESFYVYQWRDHATRTLENLLISSSYDPALFYPYDYYLQDNALLYYPYFWLAPVSFAPAKPLQEAASAMDQTVYLSFKVDTSADHSHVSIGSVGIRFVNRQTIKPSYKTWWTTDASFLSYSDTAVSVGAALYGHYYLTLYVQNQAGCTYQHQIDLYVIDSLMNQIPNVFTPNGDGINDTWDLSRAFFDELTANPPITVYVKLWDKNGKVVRQFVVNDNPKWDGTDEQGRRLPAGVYWYVIIVGNKIVHKGAVTIIY